MSLSEWKDLLLIGISGIVAILGLFDRRNAGKAKDAQINLLEARITQFQEDQLPEVVLGHWKAKIELAVEAVSFADEQKKKMEDEYKNVIEELSKERGKNTSMQSRMSELEEKIRFVTYEREKLNNNIEILAGTISQGSTASDVISKSTIYKTYISRNWNSTEKWESKVASNGAVISRVNLFSDDDSEDTKKV